MYCVNRNLLMHNTYFSELRIMLTEFSRARFNFIGIWSTGLSALPAIYTRALRLVRIYQAKHLSLWYKCYVPHYPCRLIAHQYEVETRIYYIDCLGNLIMGLHMQAGTMLYLRFSTKTGESFGKRGKFL